ncbi:MAG: tetratricopeptide repeat protein, partial [Moorea sp. SIO4G2]|nr:tetratricopeptide repeat protein [Moorena sp. SIO4G2]
MSRDIKHSSGHDHDSVDQTQGQLKVVKIQLKLAKDHANRGSLYAQQQQWPDAIACYEKAIAIDPKFAGAYRNLARVFAKTGQQEEATECWYQALTLEPNWAKPEEHVKLGNRLWSLGKPDQAITCYRQAIELKPNLLQVYYRLGEILKSQGKMEDA